MIGEHGYEGAASADQDQQAQAVSLFITDMLAAPTGQGRAGPGNLHRAISGVSA